ncbi:50S ribosomal protein L35ae [Candidatus Woesearchaeota archaeon]|nr:50S ribosomal protein L35ae [Candidatus Woesearchaeota archaeon]
MEGKIVSFRRGRRTVYNTQMIVEVKESNSSEKARSFIGKKVIWTSPGKNKKEIAGEIKTTHGNKGLLRVHFERGMPGQSVNSKVSIS